MILMKGNTLYSINNFQCIRKQLEQWIYILLFNNYDLRNLMSVLVKCF